MENLPSSLTESVVGIAVIVTVVLFLRYIQRRDDQAKKKDESFTTIISNHMQHEEAAFREMTEAMREVANTLRKDNGK